MPAISWPTFTTGIVLCLGGWMLYWVGLHLTGALVGASLGLSAAWACAVLFNVDLGRMWWIAPLGGIGGFAIGTILMRGLHRFFFFFVGAMLGLGTGQSLFLWCQDRGVDAVAANPALWQGVALVAGAALGGLVMVWCSRTVMALATATAGSALVVLSIDEPLALLAFVPLVLFSFFFQMGVLKQLTPSRPPVRERRRRERDEDADG